MQDMEIQKRTSETLDTILNKVNKHINLQNLKITKSDNKADNKQMKEVTIKPQSWIITHQIKIKLPKKKKKNNI